MNVRIKKALIDLSGTLHIENTVINGAVEALRKLRQSGVQILFVTNTSKESRRMLYERLAMLGFSLNIDEIYTSLWAARNLILNEKLRPMLIIDDNALEDFAGVATANDFDSVVVGLAPKLFQYNTLNEAFRLLKTGARLIAINEGRYHKTETGLSLGPGCFVKGLEYAADCQAHLIGKPSKRFFTSALGDTLPSEAIMIGDDVRDDVAGAQQFGIRGILVKTGKYQLGDENLISPLPSFVVDDFSMAVDLILETNSKFAGNDQ